MLGKLMKYDLRYCLRRFVPLWIAAAALSVICGLFFRIVYNAPNSTGFGLNMLTVLLPMSVFGVFVAMAVMTLVFIVERFYRGLLGSEGYLMNTLPVSAGTHIVSKGLTALILEIITGLVTLLSVTLLFMVFSPVDLSRGWQELLAMMRETELPAGTFWLILEGLILCLVTAAAETLKIYAAISVGHLAKRRRMLWAILAYIGFGIVLDILFGVSVDTGLLDRLFSGTGAITVPVQGWIAILMGTVLLFELLLGTGFFFLSRFVLKKRLNLE